MNHLIYVTGLCTHQPIVRDTVHMTTVYAQKCSAFFFLSIFIVKMACLWLNSCVCFIFSGLVISERFPDGLVGELCPSQVFKSFSAMR